MTSFKLSFMLQNFFLHTWVSLILNIFRHNCMYTQRNIFEIFLIWNQTDNRLVPNQSKNIGKYNLISGWFNKITKRFVSVYTSFVNGKYNRISVWFNNIAKRFIGEYICKYFCKQQNHIPFFLHIFFCGTKDVWKETKQYSCYCANCAGEKIHSVIKRLRAS